MMTASNIHYEIADRSRGIAVGGIGAIHTLARRLGLIEAIDRRLQLLEDPPALSRVRPRARPRLQLPLCDGTCLQDLELLRHDEVFLDALGARRIPDPTTAGDFCRRFTPQSIHTLLDIFDDTRLQVWAEQPAAFFEQAIIDMDGSLVETTGQCKQGMDIAYDGTWGYHALVLSLANTGEVLSVVNRSGNRPSQEGAAAQVDRVLPVCFRGGFRRVLLRGDTKFAQTEHLDRWNDDPRVRFIFGYEATANLKSLAEDLPAGAWQPLHCPGCPARRPAGRRRPRCGAAVRRRRSRPGRGSASRARTAPAACRGRASGSDSQSWTLD